MLLSVKKVTLGQKTIGYDYIQLDIGIQLRVRGEGVETTPVNKAALVQHNPNPLSLHLNEKARSAETIGLQPMEFQF